MAVIDTYPLTQSQPFDLGLTEEARVDLVLKRPPQKHMTRLEGKVLSSTHKVICGATVTMLDRQYNPIAHTLTNAEGRYVFENIRAPSYCKLTAGAAGYLTAKTKDIILKNGITELIDFELNKTPMSGMGVIYGLTADVYTGKPLADMSLSLCDARGKPVCLTKSDNYGQYLFTMVSPGRYMLTVSGSGYSSKSVTLLVTVNTIVKCDILLDKTPESISGTICGLVKCEYQAVENTDVGLYKIDSAGETLIRLEVTNSEGLYLFTDVPSGHYKVKSKLVKGETYQEEFQI